MKKRHQEQLINLVHETILPALPEDCGLYKGTKGYEEALQFLIDELTQAKKRNRRD